MQFSANGILYLAAPTGLFSHAADGTIWEKFVDGDVTNLGIPGYYLNCMAVQEGEHNSVYVSDFEANAYRYSYDAEAAQAASIELNVFSLRENDTVRQAVVTFNRKRSDVKVNYTVAEQLSGGGTDADYIKALNTELLAGAGPDVIILDGLPVDSYIEKGVLMDIMATVDGAEEMLKNVRAAYGTDGKLYSVPLGLYVNAVLTEEGNADCFNTLSSLAQAAQAPDGATLLSPIGYSYETLAIMLLNNYYDELVSGDTAAVSSFLENAMLVSNGIGCTDTLGAGMTMLDSWPEEEVREMLVEDPFYPQLYDYVLGPVRNVAFEIRTLADTDCMTAATDAEQNGGRLLGMGGRFTPVGLAGINRASANTDTAGEFLQTLLSCDVQSAGQYGGNCFPVNLAALDSLFAQENSNFSSSYVLDETHEAMGMWPSQTMRAQIRLILDGATLPLTPDAELTAMLLPCLISCLDGSATPEAAGEKITSVLSTYLSE